MELFIRYLLKNILEKKFRTALVILAIAVSSGLFFATSAISTTSQDMMEDRVRQFAGSSDIIVTPKKEASISQLIDEDISKEIMEKIDYAISTLEGPVLYLSESDDFNYISVMGIEAEELSRLNPTITFKTKDSEPFIGNRIMISTYLAQRYGLQAGSKMNLQVSGSSSEFTVAAICYQQGYFANESEGLVAIVPPDALSGLYHSNKNVNTVYIKLQDNRKTREVIDKLSSTFTSYDVAESVNPAELKQSVSTVSLPFGVVSILAMFISVFIICTSFNIIVIERLPVIGTFRSIGASKRRINSLLFFESIFLGIAGGVVGCLFGICALYFMASVYIPGMTGSENIRLTFTFTQLFFSFLFAVVLTTGSALFPILKVTRIPIRKIILNSEARTEGTGKSAAVAGIILFIVSLLAPRLLQTNFASFIADIICMTSFLISLVLLVPSVTKLVTRLLLKSNLLSNEASLAVKNVAASRSFLNNIKLITVSISGILLIITISTSMRADIENSYIKYHGYDITLTHRQADKQFVKELSEIEAVKGVTNTYELQNVEVSDREYYLNKVYGIEGPDYFNFMKAQVTSEATKAVENLNQGRNVIVTNILMSKLGLSTGDTVVLNLKGTQQIYTVTGSVESSLNIGNMVFISADNMSRDAGLSYYTNTYIKTEGDTNVVYNLIRKAFLKDILLIRTMKELKDINKGFISGMFDIIVAYSFLALIIGIVGIINNLIVSFIERKRFLAIYRSIGMSNKQMRKMLLAESASIGILGTFYALVGAIALIEMVPAMLSFMYGSIVMKYSIQTFLLLSLFCIVIMLFTSIIPVIKSARLSIIETIKYE